MIRRFAVPLCSLLFLLPVLAQEPPKPSQTSGDSSFLAEYSRTRGFSLGRPTRPTPTPDGSAVLFLRSGADQPAQDLYEFDCVTGQTKPLLTAAQLLKGAAENLTPEEKARRERQRSQVRGLSSFTLFDEGRKLLIPLSGKLFIVTRQSGAVEELPLKKPPIDPKLSPDGSKLAYVLDHDLYVLDLASKKETAITSGGTPEVSFGLAEFVAQEEMDRHSGFWWTGDSQHLVYQESDAREVEIWRVADPSQPGNKPREQRYPRPGKNNVKVRLAAVPATGGTPVWLNSDREKYPYLAVVRSNDRGDVTLTVQDRLQQEMVVLLADLKSGQTKPLVVVKEPTWVNIDQEFPRWVSGAAGFLWPREEDEGIAIESRSVALAPEGPGQTVIPAEANVMQVVGVDEKQGNLYFISGKDPLERHLCRMPFAAPGSGSLERLTQEPGVHRAVFSKDHSTYVVTHSGPKSLGVSTVYRAGTKVGELPSVAKEPPFLPTTEFVRLEGSPTYFAAVTRPRNFDAGKKYPVVVAVYGGPHLQTVTRTVGGQFLNQWLADQGFIVVGIDNRGTPGRGKSWERAIYQNLAKTALEDQVRALQALGAKFPELDLTRVGIRGWSFGGYMSALAVLRRPDVYHAAIAGAPVTAWEDYDTHYTERYMNLPKNNPDGYRDASLLPLAKSLTRPLLLVHGTADDNVYFIHTLKLASALTRNGQDFELLPMVGMTHGISDPALRQRFEERSARFFKKHLGEPTSRLKK